MLIHICEPVPKGVHIPRHIFAVCFQKIKTYFQTKVCCLLYIQRDISDKIVKIRGLITHREPLKFRKSTTKCHPPIAASIPTHRCQPDFTDLFTKYLEALACEWNCC